MRNTILTFFVSIMLILTSLILPNTYNFCNVYAESYEYKNYSEVRMMLKVASSVHGNCMEKTMALHDMLKKSNIPHRMVTGKMTLESKIFHVWIEWEDIILEGNYPGGAIVDRNLIDPTSGYIPYGVVDTKTIDEMKITDSLRLAVYYVHTIGMCEKYEKDHNLPPTYQPSGIVQPQDKES